MLSLAALSAVSALGQTSAPSIPIEWFGFPPPNFLTDYQSAPLFYTTNLLSVPVGIFGGVDNALILDTTNTAPACLEYAVLDSNQIENFSYDPGSVVFYFSPNWASVSQGGTGPGEKAYFIGSGDWSTGSPNGLFTIYADSLGSNIYVAGVGAGVTNIYASSPISWSSNTFHQIGVEWSSSGSRRNPGIRLYLDGALATTGINLSIVPAMGYDSNGLCTNGLFVGSDNMGGEQMRGSMWNMTTFNDMYGGWYRYAWEDISNALAAWQAPLATAGFGGMMGMNAAPPGYIPGATYTTNYADYTSFWLSIATSATRTQTVVTIQNTQSNLTYVILTNTVLDTHLADWGVWQTLTASNSVIVAPPFNVGNNAIFFASQLVLITGTNQIADWWQMLYFNQLGIDPYADPDGDGLCNYMEYTLGSNPTNAYSLDQTHTHKDGLWYLTSVAGETGTRVEMFMDPFDSYYDPYYDVTVVTFGLIGAETNDQFDIYIHTPSVDLKDTNLVWQDMFRFYEYPGGYFDGVFWYETAWPGFVPLDGSVKFAALNSQDRDADGLQDGYEVFVAHTIVGAPSSDESGIADGDADPANDGLSNLQKWQYGLNPAVPVSATDSSGSGMPDWFTNYITLWLGPGNADPWTAPSGDSMPNIVKYEIGDDPTLADYWYDSAPPPGGESNQFASVQINANYTASDGPNNNPYFPMFGNVAGPMGEGCSMTASTSGGGPGTATLNFQVWPLDEAYGTYACFAADADPSQGDLQEFDPADADLYREILFNSTDLAHGVWAHVNENVLEALSSQTLEYVHAVSMLKIQRQVRLIQFDQYLLTQGANSSGVLMRMQGSASIIHTEVTKVTAIDIQYVRKYPNLDWIGRSLTAAGYLTCAASWYYDWPTLMDDVQAYSSDVQNHTDTGAADILSSQIQSMLQGMPGMPEWLVVGLDPTIPIFSLNGPLGWYDGY
jgi:hypothetical protein